MKACRWLLLCSLLIAFSGSAMADDWTVETFHLKPSGDLHNHVTAQLAETKTRALKRIGFDTAMTNVDRAYTFNERAIFFGRAGRAQIVEILDIKVGKRIDWFICYQPQSMDTKWIAFVQYSPDHATGNPTDVVMIYDLTRSPEENRIDRIRHPETYPTRVGIPIYPSGASYDNNVASPSEAIHVLGPPFFLFTSTKDLLFLAAQGEDFPHLQNKLISVDLRSGDARAASASPMDLPFARLKRPGLNQRFLRVDSMEEIYPGKLKLNLPATEYGLRGETRVFVIVDLNDK